MLSTACKAAIKSVVYLASRERAGVKEIAKFTAESEHTVGKLLQRLVKDKIINSSKGPNGGFYLTKTQENQPIINIVNSIDGKDVFKQCALGLSKCSESKPCPLHSEYKVIRERFALLCGQKKISDLHKGISLGSTFLIN